MTCSNSAATSGLSASAARAWKPNRDLGAGAGADGGCPAKEQERARSKAPEATIKWSRIIAKSLQFAPRSAQVLQHSEANRIAHHSTKNRQGVELELPTADRHASLHEGQLLLAGGQSCTVR